MMTWRSLAFQPTFTSTASNIGYGWWSHDIGGHMQGDWDLVRLVRWVQLGVFSPIMRLHSSNSPFFNKEPWTLQEPYRSIIRSQLQLRHQLIPYLYTKVWDAHAGRPLVSPLYYYHSENPDSYEVPNEFYFGDSLLVGAITEKQDESMQMGKVNMLIPEGHWYDIFTGYRYRGLQRRNLYRTLDSIPVLLPEGAILPAAEPDSSFGTALPVNMRLLIGFDGHCTGTMTEDDSESYAAEGLPIAVTRFTYEHEGKDGALRIHAPREGLSLLPEARSWHVLLYGVREAGAQSSVCYSIGQEAQEQKAIPATLSGNILSFTTPLLPTDQDLFLCLHGYEAGTVSYSEEVFRILCHAWLKTSVKELIYAKVQELPARDFLAWLAGADVPASCREAISEVFADLV